MRGGVRIPGERLLHLQGFDPAPSYRRGRLEPKPRPSPRKLTPAQEAALAAHIAAHSDITLAAMQAWLEAEHGVRLSNGAIWTAVDRLGLTLKKRRSGPASKTVRTLRSAAGSGAQLSPTSTRIDWSSLIKPAPTPR